MNPLPVLRKIAEDARLAELKKLQEALEKPKNPAAQTQQKSGSGTSPTAQ